MKVVSTEALTKLIQLVKSAFISVDNTVETSEVELSTVATSGDYNDLTNKPTEIPSQTGQSGKFLTTDGTDVSWATIDALPSQSGQNGKFLTTDGTNASWGILPTATDSVSGVTKIYSTTGVNTDGTMTQASITSAISSAGGARVIFRDW